MSTVIPTQDWVDVLSPNLGFTFPPQDTTLPLFLIDSEGMGVRGGTFDFITTSPPAVIAKAGDSSSQHVARGLVVETSFAELSAAAGSARIAVIKVELCPT